MLLRLTFTLAALMTCMTRPAAADVPAAAGDLLRRVVPKSADRFDVQLIPADGGRDVFEIESAGGDGRIVLRGNNGVSLASAFNWYLKYDCHCQLSWGGDNLKLPDPLPVPDRRTRIVSPYPYRVAFNFCTFSYTMPFWDWDRWQREIDWMAMHGINMPLAITGEEAVWQAVLRKYGFNDDEIRQFLCGPAFFAWQWMANLEGWGGPLPQSWIDSHLKLGQQILQRERELGMTPILPGFTGFVPRKLGEKFPKARIQYKPQWCAFKGAAQLDPLDPMFPDLGKTFLTEQTRLLGTDHWYTADPFHESAPPDKSADYMPAVARTILSTMQAADPDAKIAMQTWSMRAPIVKAIPADKILLLDLEGHKWTNNDGFWDRPWVRGVIQNFGGRGYMAGDLPAALGDPAKQLHNPKAGHLAGIGIFPEATENNPIFFEAILESAWHDPAPDLHGWLRDYVHARYGTDAGPAMEAWTILARSVYGGPQGSLQSPICLWPGLSSTSSDVRRNYDPADPWRAWPLLLAASPTHGAVDTYQYDLVDLSRQCLSDLSVAVQHDITKAYKAGDAEQLKIASDQFLDLASDMDALLGTRREFLLGRWITDARKWGTTNAEKHLYEQNARWQITVWGSDSPPATALDDYSNRQWSGLIRGYYVPRWKQYLAALASHQTGPAFSKQLAVWQYQWCDGSEPYPDQPTGDPVETSRRLLAKWQPIQADVYARYDLRKLRPIGVDETVLPPVRLKQPSWSPADCSQESRDWTLDVSDQIKSAGVYTVTFRYTSGRHALRIESVSIGQKDRPPVTESHDGWTGTESHGNTYRIEVKAVESGMPVVLTARVATDAGTDSNGTITIVAEPGGK